jgi:hypothetical protein
MYPLELTADYEIEFAPCYSVGIHGLSEFNALAASGSIEVPDLDNDLTRLEYYENMYNDTKF